MDKIPPALQHKIDYINALDIPNLNKYKRIAAAMANYWADNCNGDVNISANGGKGLWNRDEYNAQRVNQVTISGINPEHMFTGKSALDIVKQHLSESKDVNSVGSFDVKRVNNDDNPIVAANVKFKCEQPSGWYLAGCFLCVSILSASLGAILERTL
jgi:hypothetical protein